MSEQAWHFCHEMLRDGTSRAKVGEWETYEGEVKICWRGLHASPRIIGALEYAPGSILRLVEVEDVVDRESDKLVCRRRKVLAEIDATEVLRTFARWCALQVVHLWDAPEVVVEYLRTGDESLRSAARAAAWGAPWRAHLAAHSTVARNAAWDAAGEAALGATITFAREAARNAAWGAASAIAWGAAGNATARNAKWDAARNAAMNAQNEELERMVLEATRAMRAMRAGAMEIEVARKLLEERDEARRPGDSSC